MTTRTSTVALEVQDKFSNALDKFSAGMHEIADAMKGVSAAAGPVKTKTEEVSHRLDQVAAKSQTMGDKLQTAFGGSSRAVNVFGNAVGNAVGLTGEFGYTLDVLMDQGTKAALSFGLMTGGVALLGAAISEGKKNQEEMAAALDEAGHKYVQISSNVDDLTAALKRQAEQTVANRRTFGLIPQMLNEDLYGLNDVAYNKSMAELAAKVKEQYEQERLMVRAQADSKAMAELQLGVERQRAQALQDEVRAVMDATKARLDYINSSQSTLRQLGGNLSWEEINTGVGSYGDYNVPGGNKNQMERFLEDQAAQRARQDKAKAEAEQNSRSQLAIIRQTQSAALSLYRQMADGGETTAKQVAGSFTDAFTSIIAAEAELNNNSSISMIQLQQVFGKAFSGMSDEMVGKLLGVMDAGGEMANALIAQLYAIAAGGGTAAEQIDAIRAALAGLPTDKYINIHVNYQSNGPGGNQQGDEWDFTLEGEAYGIRKAYMDRYGDYGRANEAWKEAHRDELRGKGVSGPGGANTKTGQTYQYAYGEHSVVTSPRLMMVGERGPERVDITPGTGARAGAGGGGSVNITMNTLIPPNEFEVRQLAAKLKHYMRL